MRDVGGDEEGPRPLTIIVGGLIVVVVVGNLRVAREGEGEEAVELASI
jgi:hypothetical protein